MTKSNAMKLLDDQAALHDELKKIPEAELLAEIQKMADDPAVRRFVRHALRIVEAAPPSPVAQQVVSLSHIMQGLDASLEARQAQIKQAEINAKETAGQADAAAE